MAKTKKAGAKTAPKKKGNKGLRQAVSRGLDRAAVAYAKLLTDPCNAPLAHPVYGGADGSYLIKAEAIITLGSSAGATCGAFQWTPGAMGQNNLEFTAGETGSPSTSFASAGFALAPGKTYLGANATAMRCVAACATVTYPGTELNRSGMIHYGHCPGGVFNAGAGYTVDQLAPVVQHSERTPSNVVEVLWVPSSNDMLWRDPSTNATTQEVERKNAILVAWRGLPAATGLTIKLTAVYEYKPQVGLGITTPSMSDTSTNDLQEVLAWLRAQGEAFVRTSAMSAASGLLRYYSRNRSGMRIEL